MDDDYVQHMLQKYRLAVTLAVIQNKPNNVTIEEYIAEIRLKLCDPQLDETLSDISINDDDFNLSDGNASDVLNHLSDENSNDSITILQNYDFNVINNTSEGHHLLTDVIQTLKNYKSNEEQHIKIAKQQPTPDLTSSITFPPNSNDNFNTQNSNNINNRKQHTNINLEYSDIPNGNITAKVNYNLQKDTFFTEKSQPVITDINIFDSQETEIYNFHSFTEANTHVSQSQDNLIIAQNFLTDKNKFDARKDVKNNINDNLVTNRVSNANFNSVIVDDESEFNNICEDSEIIHIRKKHKPIQYTDSVGCKTNITIGGNTAHPTISQDKDSFVNSQDIHSDFELKDKHWNNTSIHDSQLFSLTSRESHQNNTNIHLQHANFKRNGPLDFGCLSNSNINSTQTGVSNNETHLEPSRITFASLNQTRDYIEDNFTQSLNQFSNNELTEHFKKNEYMPSCHSSQDISNLHVPKGMETGDVDKRNILELEFSTEASTTKGSVYNETRMSTDQLITIEEPADDGRALPQLRAPDLTRQEKTKDKEEFKELNEMIDSESDIELYTDLSDSQAEVVPFKVLDELNKVKVYLNNRLESGSRADSGFKSGSRGSLYGASQSGVWINQSSHCLFSYLSECPLLVSTVDINCEIAMTLGSIIDRLHEDEKYPTFLDEILDCVNNLLKDVSEGKSDDNVNTFLKNDERIDRLLLLNKSRNIMKFTIENITKILERFADDLQSGGHLELTSIYAAENLAYTFHLLETLLKKYSFTSSQSQPASQEVPKRSTLTEMWRRRWHLSRGEVFQSDAGCDVTARCSDVLNKIIVSSMDGYSLIAFAALQCFNLLQS